MQPVTIPYLSFVLSVLLICVLVFFACYFAAKCRHQLRENLALSKAYAELLAGSQQREAELLLNLKAARAVADGAREVSNSALRHISTVKADLGRATVLYKTSAEDADRLAPIVAAYVKICDDTAALLKDESPPPMTAEREALRLHAEAVALRSLNSQPSTPNSNETVPQAAQV